jgi:di/tricarboxylate transporter
MGHFLMLFPGRDTVGLDYRGYSVILAQQVGLLGAFFMVGMGESEFQSCPGGDLMTAEMGILWAIIACAIVLFSFDVFPVDKVSLLVLASLVGTRLITGADAIAGFGNPATITVACMLALSYGVQRTGALNAAASKLIQLAKDSDLKLLVLIMIVVGGLSAFINNTAAVAIFLPVVLTICRRRNLDASKFLMPMSFAAIFAGTCTLIGTSTKLLVTELFREQSGIEIHMFDFLPMGLVFFVAGFLYLILAGRHLLTSRRTGENLTEDYRLRHFVTELVLHSDSSLVGQTVAEADFRDRFRIEVIEIIRGKERFLPTDRSARLQAGDIMLVQGDSDSFLEIQKREGVNLKSLTVDDRVLEDENLILVEAFVSPTSRLVDSTLKEIDFRRTYKASALAIRSHGRTVRQKIGKVRLEHGDSILVLTDRQQLEVLYRTQDFLVLEEVSGRFVRHDKIPYALSIFLGVVLAAGTGYFSILDAALIGTALMLLTGCLRFNEIYSNLHWQTIVMLGCLIPLGTAMEVTGTAQFLADQLLMGFERFGPTVMLSGLYLLTSVLTALMSNSATGILMLPVALNLAASLGTRPEPFVFAVMFAASASFMTPMGYQTNTFVFGPGGYRFSDFLKVGTPLNVIFWVLSTIFIPIFWPF